MIRLTRLRQTDPFYINPDHIERIEHHHDTKIRMFNGTEYVVCESPDVIVELVLKQRARVMATASRLAESLPPVVLDTSAEGLGNNDTTAVRS